MTEYIEREAIMQKFADHVKRSNNSDFAPVPTWNQAVQIVEDFPAADVRPVVRGEWEHTEGFDDYGEGRYVEWTCSVCFCKAKGGWAVRDKSIDEPPAWNFCPNCGAEMR